MDQCKGDAEGVTIEHENSEGHTAFSSALAEAPAVVRGPGAVFDAVSDRGHETVVFMAREGHTLPFEDS